MNTLDFVMGFLSGVAFTASLFLASLALMWWLERREAGR